MAEDNKVQEVQAQEGSIGKMPRYTPAFVIGILSIVFAVLFALIGDVLGVTGIILSFVKRRDYDVKAAMICSIVGLVLAIVNHALGAVLLPQLMAQLAI